MLKLIRANTWWNTIIPQIVGWIYFCLLASTDSIFIHNREKIFWFLAGVLAISIFGYLFNDYCDMESDRKSGKENVLSRLTPAVRWILIIVPLISGAAFWYLTKAGPIAETLYALQILSLTLYSAPPFRFKERSGWGIAADAFYGHINPALFTLATFLPLDAFSRKYLITFFLILILLTALKGTRNILLHQIDDRKKDQLSGVRTFVVKYGALFSHRLIILLLPFELLFTCLLVLLISIKHPPFFFSLLAFTLFTYLQFSGWKLAYQPKRQLRFKFLHFMNDYFEGWMPIFFLILLAIREPHFIFLLILHLLIFPDFIIKLWGGIWTIKQNFMTEENY